MGRNASPVKIIICISGGEKCVCKLILIKWIVCKLMNALCAQINYLHVLCIWRHLVGRELVVKGGFCISCFLARLRGNIWEGGAYYEKEHHADINEWFVSYFLARL